MRLNLLKKPVLAPEGGGGGDAASAFAAAAQAAGAKAPAEPAPPVAATTTDLDVDFVGLDSEGETLPASGDAKATVPAIPDKPEPRTTLPDFKKPTKKPFEPVKPVEAPAKQPDPAAAQVEPAKQEPGAAPLFDDPQDSVFLNKMHKEAAAHFSKRVKALSEKASKVVAAQDSFYTHPDGFTLLPEYQEISSSYASLKAEHDHWQSALAAIEEGKPFKLFEGFDEQGRPVLSADAYKPTADAKVKIQTALMGLTSDLGAKRAQAAELKGKFGTTYEQAVKVVNEERLKRFPWVRDPKLEDQELEIEGYGKATIKKIKEDLLALTPAVWRHLPVSEAMADTFIALRIAIGKLKSQAVQVKEASLVEPVVPSSAGGAKPGATEDSEFDAEGMPI